MNESVDEEEIAVFRRFKKYQIRLVIKLKGLKDSLFQGDNPQKTTFAIIVMVKVISAGIAPGIIYLDVIKMSTR